MMTDLGPSERPYIDAVTIGGPEEGGPGDVLRPITADILDSLTTEPVGRMRGWLGLRVGGAYSLADAGDRFDSDALALGVVADVLYDSLYFEDVLFIRHLYLEPEHRGTRVTAYLIRDLCAILSLDPQVTVVALIPEPIDAELRCLPDGPQHDAVRARLVAAYEEQGFARHASSTVWWLRDPA